MSGREYRGYSRRFTALGVDVFSLIGRMNCILLDDGHTKVLFLLGPEAKQDGNYHERVLEYIALAEREISYRTCNSKAI